MTIARSRQVCLEATPYYHCVSRCVRRAFLCGQDRFSGRSFEHRRGWIEQRLALLASVFAIDLCAYAVMSNHYHVVVRIDEARARAWSERAVIDRWLKLYTGPVLIHRYLAGETRTQAEQSAVSELVGVWRARLMDLGWFMRNINEPIAREANAEDGCKGRFWEGRYKCQALLDEKALLTCMAYVDLNPIRAAMADRPETSNYTAIQARIEGRDQHLAPFLSRHQSADIDSAPIPYGWHDYLQLVDWTGRAIRTHKRGAIPLDLPPILERLGKSQHLWLTEMRHYGKWYGRAVGTGANLRAYCEATATHWVRGLVARSRSSRAATS